MENIFRSMMIFLVFISFACCSKTNEKGTSEVKEELNKKQLHVLLEQAMKKLDKNMKSFGLEIDKYKRDYDLAYDQKYGRWDYGPWSIFKKEDNHYEMEAVAEFFEFGNEFEDLAIFIIFSTGEVYTLEECYMLMRSGQIEEIEE